MRDQRANDPRLTDSVIADLLEERGLSVSKLRALLALLEQDGCWACVPGATAWPPDAHLHSATDRALAIWYAARRAKHELRALVIAADDAMGGR
ncbi:MAG: hypothetical protein INH41_01265 [Myxococcaceae bacterium]|jgi:hypothetical protein|nr:hypothetical protein [Myxococcaceae bacterium]MCA3011007.1 hypothetical protein [Myxococcaceae bacterium]